VAVTKITSKGQITIPQKVRKRLGVGPGDKVEFKELNGKFVVEKKVEYSPFDKYVGYLKKKRGREPDAIVEKLRGR
jgi:AbrB family looped-hinge helix DNA binding protein